MLPSLLHCGWYPPIYEWILIMGVMNEIILEKPEVLTPLPADFWLVIKFVCERFFNYQTMQNYAKKCFPCRKQGGFY